MGRKKGDRHAISRYGAAVAIGVCRLPGNAGIAGEAFAISLFFCSSELLHINGVLLGETLQYGRLVELLAGAEFFNDTCSFKFSLKSFQGAFDVFALFNGYYDHCF